MVNIEPTARPRRVTSPLDRLAFIVPLLSRDNAASDDSEDTVDNAAQSSPRGGRSLLSGAVGGAAALIFGTGLSLTACSITDVQNASAKIIEVPQLLRGLGLRRNPKTWTEYQDEMVEYISGRSYSALLSGVEGQELEPILAGSFSHFPSEEHAALAHLLPSNVQQWANVHWTIAYSQFLDRYGLTGEYQNDESVLLDRFAQYRKNGELVYKHNKRSAEYADDDDKVEYLYTLELNRFADLREEDLLAFGYIDPTKPNRKKPATPANAEEQSLMHLNDAGFPWDTPLPEQFDWKEEGCVQVVKNQMRCGSCWAFSAVEALESAVCVAKKKKGVLGYAGPVSPNDDHGKYTPSWTVANEMPNLSEQQLVDCAAKDGNHGCQGGMMEFAFQYVMENDNAELCDEDSYQYLGVEGQCQETKCSYKKDWKVVSWNNVTRFSPPALQKAIMTFGTIAVSVEADNPMFMMYKGGVVHDGKTTDEENDKTCGTALNHGVAVVGWGTDPDTKEPYWLVKNSWGPQWGEEGFIRLARNSGGMFGECGILMDASYPIIKAYHQPHH